MTAPLKPRSNYLPPQTSSSPKKCRASTLRCLLLAITLFSLALCFTLGLGLGDIGDEDVLPFKQDDVKSSNTSSRVRHTSSFEKKRVWKGQTNQRGNDGHDRKATIAYAVSLTSCGHTGSRSDPSFHEGAAVLQHSIHLSSYRNPSSGSLYDYKLIAFVHPDAQPCSGIFGELGYEVQIRDTPFNASDIRGQFLREHVVKSGCCGEKEYLKLYSYTLLEYPVVVHLDLDSLILQPLDDLFDVMLDAVADDHNIFETNGGTAETLSNARKKVPVMHGAPLPRQVDAFFTRDYNMVNPGHRHVGVQGGFLVVRPSIDAFNEYVSIVLEGNFIQGNGWGGKGYGGYFGAQQIQGICSYYYDYKHPGTAVELNRCNYNAMVDSPRQTSKDDPLGKCRDGKPTCEDCRETAVRNIKSVHFTLCQKPWKCPLWHGLHNKTITLCKQLHHEWFRIREDLDRRRATKKGKEYKNPGGKHRPEVFRGYCTRGVSGYIPIGSSSI